MSIELREAEVIRYFTRDTFNPGSSKQLLAYMKAKGLQGGRNPKSKTGGPSADKDTLRRLARRDPLFGKVLEWREISKINNTYVLPNIHRIAEEGGDGRIHPSFLHSPSTMRLSCHDPNIQNVPGGDDPESLAVRFRNCIVAADDCLLIDADFSAIEAVETCYFSGESEFMRVAKWAHTFVLAVSRGEKIELSWSDDDLAQFLTEYKQKVKGSKDYAAMKRGVHLTNYGGTPRMMNLAHPELFPSVAVADKVQQQYFDVVPKLRPWQRGVRERAASQHYLGGRDHPFRYKHWFWDVVAWDARRRKEIPGSDWNRVVAYYPQSTSAGVLFDACLRMTDPDSPYYVGDLCKGRTPIRALVHDSILAEVPKKLVEVYLERCLGSMSRPIDNQGGLVIGVDVKLGRDWGSMKPLRSAS